MICEIGKLFEKMIKSAKKGNRSNLHHVWVDVEKKLCYATNGKLLISAEIDLAAEKLTGTGFYDLIKTGVGYVLLSANAPELRPPSYEMVIPQTFTVDDIFEKFEKVKLNGKDDWILAEKNRLLIQLAVLKAKSFFISPVYLDWIAGCNLEFDWTIFKNSYAVFVENKKIGVRIVALGVVPNQDPDFFERIKKFF